MKGKNLDEDWPSLYDAFYMDYWIANKLCELNSIRKIFRKYKIDLKKVYYGYLYLLELVIISLVNHVEDLIEDRDISELIHWGSVSTKNKELRELIKSHSEVKYIISLLSIRKELSSQRRKTYDENEVLSQLNKLKETLGKLNKFFVEKYKISKVEKDKKKEVIAIMSWILANYNWLEVKFSFDSFEKEILEPIWPGSPFFYMMPDNMAKNYHLQRPELKSKENAYSNGFSLILLYLYKNLIPKQIDTFEKDLLNVKNWLMLDKIGRKISNKTVKNQNVLIKLFKMNYRPKKIKLEKKRVENYEELRLVFRGRKTIVITDRFRGDYPKQSLFLHVLFGAIQMNKINLRDKPEIIEFKQIYENGNWIEYSYAIYSPISGMLWDASHWIIFDKLYVESDVEPSSSAKIAFDIYIKHFKKNISFHKYEINGDLLRRYIEKNDSEIKTRKDQEERLKASKGLLGEFLAGFYLIKEEGITNLYQLDFHRDHKKSTDIDVLGETKNCVIIVQVKPNLSFDSDENKKILENFSKISKGVPKSIKKVLFVIKEEIPEGEEHKLWEDEKIPKGGIITITVEDIENKKQEIINFFKTNNVEIVFLRTFKERLTNEAQYYDLLDKLNIVFSEVKKSEYE